MLTPQTSGRQTSIRLPDVPIEIRRLHGQRLIDRAFKDMDLYGAIDLKRAIEEPSDTLYWVPAKAVRKVLGRD